MKFNSKFKLITTAIALVFFSQVSFSEVLVIVNKNNASSLNNTDIKRIFLGKMKSFPSGGPILAINHSANSEIRKSFDKAVLGKSSSQIKAYWSKLVFSGKGNPPKEMPSDAEIIKLVSKNPAVIGYIESSSKTDTIKIVGNF